jgi:putative alpha-1,2-mannosidase
MIPSVAPPFGMTRWSPQTRQNCTSSSILQVLCYVEGEVTDTRVDVSMCPYNQTDERIHGFIGTHQPAIWMGTSSSFRTRSARSTTTYIAYTFQSLMLDLILIPTLMSR